MQNTTQIDLAPYTDTYSFGIEKLSPDGRKYLRELGFTVDDSQETREGIKIYKGDYVCWWRSTWIVALLDPADRKFKDHTQHGTGIRNGLASAVNLMLDLDAQRTATHAEAMEAFSETRDRYENALSTLADAPHPDGNFYHD